MKASYRIGHGFDAHRLQRGRKLMLGGVRIPHRAGAVGHSDADVVLHALINALLGAMGKGDIGTHFPDTDPRYKGISSEVLMKKVLGVMQRARLGIVNCDVTVLAERPRLSPFFPEIRTRMARLMKIAPGSVNLKASTTEKMGWIGKEQGIAAAAVVLLEKRP